MKNIILTMAIFATLSCKAQTIIDIHDENYSYPEDFVPNQQYFKDINHTYDPFIGTWQWTNGADTLTIVFDKIEMAYDNLRERYSDELVGKYRYVENGVEVINTLDYGINASNVYDAHPTYTYRAFTPILGGVSSSSFETGSLFYSDYLKSKGEKMIFKLLDLLANPNGGGTATQAKLTLSNSEHWNINGQNPRDPAFTIPNNIVLIKQ